MALIECPDCKKQVSDTAPSCPGCGYGFAAATARATRTRDAAKVNQNAAIWFAVAFIGLVLILAAAPPDGEAIGTVSFIGGVMFLVGSPVFAWKFLKAMATNFRNWARR